MADVVRTYGTILRHPQLRTLFLVGFLLRIPVAGSAVLLTLHVVTHLHLGYAQAGVLAAVYTVSSAVSQPWRGRMLDRVGLRRTMVSSLIVLPVVWSVAPFVGYWPLLALSVIAGLLLIPIYSILRQAIVAVCPPDLRRSALSLDSVVVEFSYMLGPAIAVLVATAFGTVVGLLVFYVGGSLLCLVIYALNPQLQPEATDTAGGSPGRWLTPGAIAMLTMMGAATFVLGTCDVTIIAALRGIGKAGSLAGVLTLWSAGSAVGGIIYGGLKRSVHPAWFLAGMSLLTLPVVFMRSDVLIAAFLFASGLCCAPLIASTVDGLSRMVPSSRFGEAMGWHASAGTVGGAVGAPLGGALIDSVGWPWAFAAAVAVGLLVAVLGGAAITLRRRRA